MEADEREEVVEEVGEEVVVSSEDSAIEVSDACERDLRDRKADDDKVVKDEDVTDRDDDDDDDFAEDDDDDDDDETSDETSDDRIDEEGELEVELEPVLEPVLELVLDEVELVVVLNEDELVVEDFKVSENVLDDRKMDAE